MHIITPKGFKERGYNGSTTHSFELALCDLVQKFYGAAYVVGFAICTFGILEFQYPCGTPATSST